VYHLGFLTLDSDTSSPSLRTRTSA